VGTFISEIGRHPHEKNLTLFRNFNFYFAGIRVLPEVLLLPAAGVLEVCGNGDDDASGRTLDESRSRT